MFVAGVPYPADLGLGPVPPPRALVVENTQTKACMALYGQAQPVAPSMPMSMVAATGGSNVSGVSQLSHINACVIAEAPNRAFASHLTARADPEKDVYRSYEVPRHLFTPYFYQNEACRQSPRPARLHVRSDGVLRGLGKVSKARRKQGA